MQHLRAERLQQAKVLYEQILQVNPRNAEALQWLGVIFFKQGNSRKAIEIINQSITENPQNAFVYSTLGNVLKGINQRTAAIESYRKALAIKPDFVEALNNLGIVLSTDGQLDEAIESYRKALLIYPNYTEALNNLGTALHAKGKPNEAIDAFRKALALDPKYGQALFNLGNTMLDHAPEQAMPFIRQSLTVNPSYYEAWVTLGKLQNAQGFLDQASACFQRAISIKPSPGLNVFDALMLPPIMGTNDEVAASRLRFENNLEKLTAEGVTVLDPLKEFCKPNFHLAYHGRNDKDLQVKVANFYERACPSLLYVAPHCIRPKIVGKKRRIGFLSKFIAMHSVASSFSSLINEVGVLGEFEVALISSGDMADSSLREAYSNFGGKYFRITLDLPKAREQVAALELDVLVYLDIGMDPFSYFLAYSRLAPIQCVAGGHPVTTGISAMDYFLSADLAEIADAQLHYSEKLVRLPFGLLYLERPVLPTTHKSRSELGLPEEGHVYICPMTLHKLHPDFDAAIERILQLDSSGHVVFVADAKYSVWREQLDHRFNLTISKQVRHRVIFMPWVSDPLDFMRVVDASDVVLDSFHFGVGTTIAPIASVGTPFVTMPSDLMRGRVGLYFCKLMDLMECVVHDVEDYAVKAVTIASNPSERERLKSTMLANNHVLFRNPKAIEDFSNFLGTVCHVN